MKIGAVIVLYNPVLDILRNNIKTLINDCYVVLINNGKRVDVNINHPNIYYKELGENKGIAYALNRGIGYCIENEYDYVITLDQDSQIDCNLIRCLLNSYEELYKIDNYIAALSPIHINVENNMPYKYNSIKCLNDYLEVRELLTSGMFLKTSIFKEIGGMDDKLFIDGVDFEWSWRVRSQLKKHLYMDTRIKMYHKLGEGDKRLLGRNIAIATPFRCYYQYRNYFVLSTYNYTPISWIIKNGFKYFIRLFYYPLFVRPRWKYLSSSFKGLYSGLMYIFTRQL